MAIVVSILTTAFVIWTIIKRRSLYGKRSSYTLKASDMKRTNQQKGEKEPPGSSTKNTSDGGGI